MTQLVQECYCSICEILCLVNAEALLDDVSRLLLDFTTLKQQTDMVQFMVQIYS